MKTNKNAEEVLNMDIFKYDGSIKEEILAHDVIIRMPSKKKYYIKAKIVCVRKAEPKIILFE